MLGRVESILGSRVVGEREMFLWVMVVVGGAYGSSSCARTCVCVWGLCVRSLRSCTVVIDGVVLRDRLTGKRGPKVLIGVFGSFWFRESLRGVREREREREGEH